MRLGGFRTFVLRGNVVDLAVGIVIGGASGNVVQTFVKDLINPLIVIFGGNPDASGVSVMRRIAAPSGEEVADAAAEIIADRLRGRPPEDGGGARAA
jgi:large conductance mechanosensitive channel protein